MDGLIAAPAALADYIATQPDLLEKPKLRVVVMGTSLDAADGGAWWSIIGTLLDKPADWCNVHVVHHDDADLDMQVRPPALVKTHVHVAKGDLSDIRRLPPEIDIVFLPISSPEVLVMLLGNKQFHLWPFVNAGAAVITGFPSAHEAALHSAIGKVFGLQLTEHQNKFVADEVPIQSLVIGKGAQPTDWEERTTEADQLASASDVIDELCCENFSGSQQPDAFTVWGTEGLIKSSSDSTDTYITLPRRYAVRRRTGVVYQIENDLAIGDGFAGKLPPEAFAELPLDAGWAERIAWAASAWRSGVGDMVNNTLGGAMETAGFEMPDKADMRDLMTRLGMPDEHLDALADVLEGGGHYAPSRQERQVLDRLKEGDAPGLIKLLEEDKSLLTTMDETRLPLLTAVGRRGMHDVMRRMLELGTPVDIRDGGGRTALTELAATGRNAESVKILLGAGANPDAADARGWTALLMAIKSSRWENASLLLDRGADPTIPNIVGMSAVGLARDDYPMQQAEQTVFETMRQLTGFDVSKALKQNQFITTAHEIPSDLRNRLLSYR